MENPPDFHKNIYKNIQTKYIQSIKQIQLSLLNEHNNLMYHFVFPENPEKYNNKKSIREIKDMITEDLTKYKNLKYVFRKVIQPKTQKLRYCVNCYRCSAKLWFQYEEGHFRLKKTQTKHYHIQLSHKVYKRDEEYAFRIQPLCRYNSLFINQQMNLNYFLFHRCLYITFCQLAQIRIIYFSGVSNQQFIKLVGVALFETLTESRFTELVKSFFEGKKLFPETIIFNRRSFMKSVKEVLPIKVQLIYYPDGTFNSYDKNCIIEQLVKLKTSIEFKTLKNSILFSAREQANPLSYKEVFQTYEQYTLYKLPKAWIGIELHPTLPELLYHQTEEAILLVGLKSVGVLLKNFPTTIQIGSLCREDGKNYCIAGKGSYLKQNAFIHLFEELQTPALNWIVTEYGNSFALDLQHKIKGDKMYFHLSKGLEQIQMVQEQNQQWACTCGLKHKTGLPCCHIIKCCVIMNTDIGRQIDEFWYKGYIEKKTKQYKQEQGKVTFEELEPEEPGKEAQVLQVADDQISEEEI